MARIKHTRPMVGKEPTERHSVSLPPDVSERLRKAGAGNLSAGIRVAEMALTKHKR